MCAQPRAIQVAGAVVAAVPEPATVGLGLVGLIALLSGPRRGSRDRFEGVA